MSYITPVINKTKGTCRMEHFNKKQTASQAKFSEFTRKISTEVIERYCPSYSTLDTVRNTWRANLPYTQEIADLLVLKARVFVRMLDEDSSDSKNLGFLDALTTRMADYLSAYTMRAPDVPKRKVAKEILKRQLFTEFSYIVKLKAKQQFARNTKHTILREAVNSKPGHQR